MILERLENDTVFDAVFCFYASSYEYLIVYFSEIHPYI
jgi:hypothetical protein